jgi:hypothetical protein
MARTPVPARTAAGSPPEAVPAPVTAPAGGGRAAPVLAALTASPGAAAVATVAGTRQGPDPAITAEAVGSVLAVTQAADAAGKALADGDLKTAAAALEDAREHAARGRRVLKAAAGAPRRPGPAGCGTWSSNTCARSPTRPSPRTRSATSCPAPPGRSPTPWTSSSASGPPSWPATSRAHTGSSPPPQYLARNLPAAPWAARRPRPAPANKEPVPETAGMAIRRRLLRAIRRERGTALTANRGCWDAGPMCVSVALTLVPRCSSWKPVRHWRTAAAVTDGGGRADRQRASTRRSALETGATLAPGGCGQG